MYTREQLDPDVRVLDPEYMDAAILGLVTIKAIGETVVVYDSAKVIELLVEHEGMSHEDATEYFEFNIVDAYVGPQTPVYYSRPGGLF